MTDKPPHNVFISWAEERSKYIAEFLRDWLPPVVQAARPFMSSADIDKGARGFWEIVAALQDVQVGIVCLTPENLANRWILYEAGALTKTADAKTRLLTLLLGGLQPEDIPPPLGLFQASRPVKGEVLSMVLSINRSISDSSLGEAQIRRAFENAWPELSEHFDKFPKSSNQPAKRGTPEMLAEILGHVRGLAVDPNYKGVSRDELWVLAGHYYRASPEAAKDIWEYTMKFYGRDELISVKGHNEITVTPGVVEVLTLDGEYARYEGVERVDRALLHKEPPAAY